MGEISFDGGAAGGKSNPRALTGNQREAPAFGRSVVDPQGIEPCTPCLQSTEACPGLWAHIGASRMTRTPLAGLEDRCPTHGPWTH